MNEKPVLLITDDSNIARRGIINLLNADEYEFLQAKNGNEAIEIVKNNKVDCILLDLLMPDMDGFEVLKHLKEQNNQIPIIVLSADIQDSTRQMVFELGATEFINKPPKKDLLIQTVSNLIHSSGGV